MGDFYRNIRTTQEKRAWYYACELKKEYPLLKLRSKRSTTELPDYRDEHMRQDGEDRSWKRHRFTQYKIKTSKNKAKEERPKVIYDSPWFIYGYRYRRKLLQYRVRQSYRRILVK